MVYHQNSKLIPNYLELSIYHDDILLIILNNKMILFHLDLIEYLSYFLTIDNPNKFHIYLENKMLILNDN